MDIYNLFKKVFNNKTISNVIWEQVRYEDCDQELYNDGLSKLKTTKDLTIEYMLSNELYSLFDDYMDYYFKFFIQDKSSKHWQYLIYELTKTEIELILNYKSLGFNRFKLIYKHFGIYFKMNGSIVLLNAAKGGNAEIFQFLLQQGYQLPLKLPRNCLKLECGGNFEIFTELINFYKTSLNKDDPNELSCTLHRFIETNQPKQYTYLMMEYTQVFGEYSEMVLLGLALKFSDCKLIDHLIDFYGIEKLAVTNLKHVKFIESYYPYKTEIYDNSINISYSHSNGSKTTHIIDFKTFMYYLSKVGVDINGYLHLKVHHEDETFDFLTGVDFKNYSFENSNYYISLMIQVLLDPSKYYYPTFQEFKRITSSDFGVFGKKNTFDVTNWGMDLLSRLSIHISNQLFDIEYMDYFLKHIYIKEKEKEKGYIDESEQYIRFQLPAKVLDTKFEMVEFLFNNYRDKLTTNEMLIRCDLYKNRNAFFGDVRSARFYLSLVSICPTNKFYSLENGIMGTALKFGYLQLIQFYISIKRQSKELSYFTLQTLATAGQIKQVHFETLKLILSLNCDVHRGFHPWLLNKRHEYSYIIEDTWLCRKPKFKHFIHQLHIKNGGKFNLEFHGILKSNDYQLFKLYSKLDGKLLNIGSNGEQTTPAELSLFFECASYKILDYAVNQLNIRPSNSKTIEKPGLFHVLNDNDPKRLCWFIENDINFIIQNTDQLIEMSCYRHEKYYLNLIFSQSSLSNQLKLNILIKVIKLSITYYNNIEKEEDDEKKEVKKEKKEVKQEVEHEGEELDEEGEGEEEEEQEEKEFDPYEYNSEEEEASDFSDEEVVEAEQVEIETDPEDEDEIVPWFLILQLNLDNEADKQSIKSLVNKKELNLINRYFLETIDTNLGEYKKVYPNIIELIEFLQ